ncbi:hypothetical protein HZB03_04145 [Candidatus Woesearchaeota archaeon]|nr:hypothetical protein [Candidatus Woesearchaeota archaeon]
MVRNFLASPPRSPPPPFRERWTITRSHRQGGCPQRPSIRWHSISSPIFAALQSDDER